MGFWFLVNYSSNIRVLSTFILIKHPTSLKGWYTPPVISQEITHIFSFPYLQFQGMILTLISRITLIDSGWSPAHNSVV